LCVGLTVRTIDRIMCVFTIFNRLHFCEINSYIYIHNLLPEVTVQFFIPTGSEPLVSVPLSCSVTVWLYG